MTNTRGRIRPLTVGDVMTATVVTVGESATFHHMVMLMKEHGISALPVVGTDGRLIGIVSEADLLLKEAPPSDPSANRLWPESRESRIARAKSKGVSAADVRTQPVQTVSSKATLSAAARLMQQYRVKRLPVLDEDGALVGIASRRDLLSAFTRSDEDIRNDIVEGVMPSWLAITPDAMRVSVVGGVVSLRGTVDRRSDVEALEHVVSYLDGVVRVDAQVGYEFDDSHVKPSREAPIR